MQVKNVSEYVRAFSSRLVFKAVLILLITTAVAGALLYAESLRLPLPESYGRAIATIGLYKLQIIKNGVYIYAMYALFVLAGVFLISLLYSYRVARPFKMIKDLAMEMAAGRSDVDIKFCEHEEVHPLAEAMSKMAIDCKEREERLRRELELLSVEAKTLIVLCKIKDKEEFDLIYRSLLSKAQEIERAFTELKL